MYHKVDVRSPTMWWVDVATFYQQMLALRDRKVVYLDDYDPADRSHVVVSFDGVYRNVLQFAAPVLQRLGYPFELFVSSDLIGSSNEFDFGEPAAPFAAEQDLRRLVSMGGRLQWHTRSHPRLEYMRVDRDWSAVERELSIPDDVRALDTAGFRWFAYPYGAFSADVYAETKRHFIGAVSCHQGNDSDPYCLNRVTVTNSTNLRTQSICVIIVSHNYGQFLSEAVESVLQQTYMPDSILIMDDASSDATQEIARRYESLRPDLIRFVRNDQRQGIVNTFNRAARETSSDYICFLGADNRLPSNYIEQTMGVLASGSDRLAVAYTDFLLFGSRAQDEYLRHEPKRRGRVIDDTYYEITFPDFSASAFLEGSFIHGSSVYSRTAFESVGGYHEKGSRPEDANLFRRMIRAGFTAAKAHGTWLEYRQHSDEQANIISRTQGELDFYRVYARRLEFKVKALEKSFGLLSPVVRLLSVAERLSFETAVKLVKAWRRIF